MPRPQAAPAQTPTRLQAMARLRLLQEQDVKQYVEKAPPRPLMAYRYDPVGYIREKLHWNPWAGTQEFPGQVEVLDAYTLALRQQHERNKYEKGESYDETVWRPGMTIKNRLRIEAGHTVGKCVASSEYLTLGDGRRVKAGELIGSEFTLPTLVDGKIVAVPANAEFNAIERVWAVTTESGKRIVRNIQHPVWAAYATFTSGRRLQIEPARWTAIQHLEPGMVIGVAEQTAETGSLDLDENIVKMLAYLIGDGGLTNRSVRFSQEKNAQLDEFISCADALGCVVDYVGQYDYIVVGKNRRIGRNNPVLNLCCAHGIMGVGAREKRVPAAIWQLTNDQLRIFLSRLYSTDGWASLRSEGGVEIGYGSSSYGLITDLQDLLLRFGIHARIFYKQNVKSWTLGINHRLDALAFTEQIGIFGKEDAVEKVAVRARAATEAYREAVTARPDRPRWCHKKVVAGTRWERIESVEPIGVEPTVAIEVPGHETFLTTFWEHNTKLASGIVNHFFDTCPPAIIYTFAPTYEQIKDLLWKEIRSDRRHKGLPGRILDLGLVVSDNHFAKGRAANNVFGAGTERIQGQHGEYLMFVVDEAEGVADFVFNAIESMASGGIVIVLMLANPRTRISQFHKQASLSATKNFRISCLNHPNVTQDREVVPGAVRRQYVESMIEQHAQQVKTESADDHTFQVPWKPGVIFKPDAEFLFRVLGIAPLNISDNTMIPVGRYEAAVGREAPDAVTLPNTARIGIDIARFGKDAGKMYCRRGAVVWREREFHGADLAEYAAHTKSLIYRLASQGVNNLEIRVDAGGGYGGGIIDFLKDDADIKRHFLRFVVVEVHFNGTPYDTEAFHDLATEMYAAMNDQLPALSLQDAPEALGQDLCERTYRWVVSRGVSVKRLDPKDAFRDAIGRSPDDGDGCVLACAPDHLFASSEGWDASAFKALAPQLAL